MYVKLGRVLLPGLQAADLPAFRTCLIRTHGPLSEQSYVLFRSAHFVCDEGACKHLTMVFVSAQQLQEHHLLQHARGDLSNVHDTSSSSHRRYALSQGWSPHMYSLVPFLKPGPFMCLIAACVCSDL